MQGTHQSPVNSPHKGQWRKALMFSLICTWTNGWVNNRDAGDLRCYQPHYDVTVMRYWDICTVRTHIYSTITLKVKPCYCWYFFIMQSTYWVFSGYTLEKDLYFRKRSPMYIGSSQHATYRIREYPEHYIHISTHAVQLKLFFRCTIAYSYAGSKKTNMSLDKNRTIMCKYNITDVKQMSWFM